ATAATSCCTPTTDCAFLPISWRGGAARSAVTEGATPQLRAASPPPPLRGPPPHRWGGKAKRLERLAPQQLRQIPRRPARLVHEGAAQGGDVVDRRHAQIARQPHRRQVVREQPHEAVEACRKGRVVEAAPRSEARRG